MNFLRIDILTLFPDSVSQVLGESIIGRAAKKGLLEINCVQIRQFTDNKQGQVDDYPYGGGFGCVMMAQPLKASLDHVMESAGARKSRVIFMSPQGAVYNQETAKRLHRDYDHLVLICGHYEGIDERFIEACVDEEISLGDFVMTGGEIAAMAVADSVCRMVPGVLADETCVTEESHWDSLLEYPQYTRPEVWEGRAVPEVLLQGNHENIRLWRRGKQLERTLDRRPDLFEAANLDSREDKRILAQIEAERTKDMPPFAVDCRRAEPSDLDAILSMTRQAQAFLKDNGVDQWQNGYPTPEIFLADFQRGEGWIFTVNGEEAGYLVVSAQPESCYAGISEGGWMGEGPYCALHRVMAAARFRGTPLANEMLSFAADLARGLGAETLRTDTQEGNLPMQKLLGRNGFTYRGVVYLDATAETGAKRLAFEKPLYV